MKKSGKKVTIVDIAKELGVSNAMVSMVLSGKGSEHRISEKAAKRVFEREKKLGYKPNQMAKALRTGKSGVLGLIVADIANPFFANIARSIENEAEKFGYQVMFASSDEDLEKFTKLGEAFIGRQVDGLIIVPVIDSQDIIAAWHSMGIPIVSVDRYFSTLKIPFTATDNFDASFQIIKFIVIKGYKKIAFIGKNRNLSNYFDREAGFIHGVKHLKLSPGQFKVFSLDYFNWEVEIRSAIQKIIDEKYDIVYFSQNLLGIQGLKILREYNVLIPDNIAVISFDNPLVFEFYNPPVTCFEQPLEIIASEALSCIIRLIDGKETGIHQSTKHKGRLIIRESC